MLNLCATICVTAPLRDYLLASFDGAFVFNVVVIFIDNISVTFLFACIKYYHYVQIYAEMCIQFERYFSI